MFTYHNIQALDNKTVSDWAEEIRTRGLYFHVKYENSFYRKPYSSNLNDFYNQTMRVYNDLYSVLSHLQRYRKPIDNIHCHSCRYDPIHSAKIDKLFSRWKPYIVMCRDGFHYKDL